MLASEIVSKWMPAPAMAGLVAAGLICSVIVVADQPDPGVELDYCPPGISSVPEFNSIQLGQAALVCHENGFSDDALDFFLASMARHTLDIRIPVEVSIELHPTHEGINELIYELLSRLESLATELFGQDHEMLIDAFLRVLEYQPSLSEGRYDPGWPVSEIPDEEVYKADFSTAVAWNYALMVPHFQREQDPRASRIMLELKKVSGSGVLSPEISESRMKGLENELKVRELELREERIEYYVPELVMGKIFNFGLFNISGDIELIDAEETVDGIRLLVDEFAHQTETTVVPAATGISFGFEFEIVGIIEGTEEFLEMRAIHPPIRNAMDALQTVSTATLEAESLNGRINDHLTYAFTSEHHLVPGAWTLQVLYNGDVVIGKTFEVIDSEEWKKAEGH